MLEEGQILAGKTGAIGGVPGRGADAGREGWLVRGEEAGRGTVLCQEEGCRRARDEGQVREEGLCRAGKRGGGGPVRGAEACRDEGLMLAGKRGVGGLVRGANAGRGAEVMVLGVGEGRFLPDSTTVRQLLWHLVGVGLSSDVLAAGIET
jgi:hypothetical protein